MLFQSVDNTLDQGAIVVRHLQLNSRWQVGNYFLFHTPGDFIDYGHGVGVLHLHDAKTNRWLTIKSGELAEICQTVFDFGKVT